MEALSSDPEYCLCQAPGCGSGQLMNQRAADSYMICRDCHGRTCIIHEMVWHEGFTCAEIDERQTETRRLETEANNAYLAANTKTCPNQDCGQPIEKSGGCQHMTCELPIYVKYLM